jgi:hypothetical protein
MKENHADAKSAVLAGNKAGNFHYIFDGFSAIIRDVDLKTSGFPWPD